MTTYGDSADRRPPLPLAARPGLAGRSEVEVAMLAPGSLWATGAAGDRDQARRLRGVSSCLPPISVLLAGEAAAAPPAGSPSTGPPPRSPGLAEPAPAWASLRCPTGTARPCYCGAGDMCHTDSCRYLVHVKSVMTLVLVDRSEAAHQREWHHQTVEDRGAGNCTAGITGPNGRNCSAIVAGNPGEEFDGPVTLVSDVEGDRRTADHSSAYARLCRERPLVDVDPPVIVSLTASVVVVLVVEVRLTVAAPGDSGKRLLHRRSGLRSGPLRSPPSALRPRRRI